MNCEVEGHERERPDLFPPQILTMMEQLKARSPAMFWYEGCYFLRTATCSYVGAEPSTLLLHYGGESG